MIVRLAEAALYGSLAPPGTKACDAGGGAFRPEWREEPVSTGFSSTISSALAHFYEYVINQAASAKTQRKLFAIAGG
jgi:hypothetical protein